MDEKQIEKAGECIMMCCPDVETEPMKGVRKKMVLKLDEVGCRGNMVMTRLTDDDLKQIDSLVEIEAFKSRSEAAAFFIKEGIQARKDLFQSSVPTVDKIRELKEEAKKSLNSEA